MGLRVWKEKILLVIHIRSLGEETLAYRVYMQQKENKWPGLFKETTDICAELQIEDCNYTTLSKSKYKNLVQEACHRKNEERLRANASEVKCVRMKNESYGRKSYIGNTTIEESRNWFRTRFISSSFCRQLLT